MRKCRSINSTSSQVKKTVTGNDTLTPLTNLDEELELQHYHKHCDRGCCCPKFLKFNFFFCDVDIKNDNAECKDKKRRHYGKIGEEE